MEAFTDGSLERRWLFPSRPLPASSEVCDEHVSSDPLSRSEEITRAISSTEWEIICMLYLLLLKYQPQYVTISVCEVQHRDYSQYCNNMQGARWVLEILGGLFRKLYGCLSTLFYAGN